MSSINVTDVISLSGMIVSALGLFGGGIAALICFFCVKPARRKLIAIEAELQRGNESIASMRNALLDSAVRLAEAKYSKLAKACEDVFSAFMKNYESSSGLLMICASLRDLEEIKIAMQRENKLENLRAWLGSFVKDDLLIPVKVETLTAELYVPSRIWELYCVAGLLHASAVAQMMMLKSGLDLKTVKREDVYERIEKLIPGQKKFLDEFGTLGYRSTMEAIKTTLIMDMRKALKNDPVKVNDIISINMQLESEVKIPPVRKGLEWCLQRNEARRF